MAVSEILKFFRDVAKFAWQWKTERKKIARRLRRIRQDIERCGELAREIFESKLTAPAHRMPTNAWSNSGGQLMDDGILSEEEYRQINTLFDLAGQCNNAVDEAAQGLQNPTPAIGPLLSRPLIKAQHILEGNPSTYDKALGSIASALDRLV